MPTPEQVRSVVETYVKTMEAGDRDGWVALWADDAVHHDPPSQPPHVGQDAIAAFWDEIHLLTETFSYDVRDVWVVGDEAAMVFTLTIGLTGGMRLQFDAVEVFAVGDDGRITSMKAFLDETAMRPVD